MELVQSYYLSWFIHARCRGFILVLEIVHAYIETATKADNLFNEPTAHCEDLFGWEFVDFLQVLLV